MDDEPQLVLVSPPRRRGRPPSAERAERRIALRVTADELAELHLAAKANGRTVAGLVRDAVLEYVAAYEEHRAFAVRPTVKIPP